MRVLAPTRIFKRANTNMVSPFTFKTMKITTAGFGYMTCFQANAAKPFQ